jgi:hypothetical protein
MKKLTFRVSGSRVGDAVRPASDAPAIDAPIAVATTKPRFGLRVHSTIVVKPAAIIAPEDYATAEDYE